MAVSLGVCSSLTIPVSSAKHRGRVSYELRRGEWKGGRGRRGREGKGEQMEWRKEKVGGRGVVNWVF